MNQNIWYLCVDLQWSFWPEWKASERFGHVINIKNVVNSNTLAIKKLMQTYNKVELICSYSVIDENTTATTFKLPLADYISKWIYKPWTLETRLLLPESIQNNITLIVPKSDFSVLWLNTDPNILEELNEKITWLDKLFIWWVYWNICVIETVRSLLKIIHPNKIYIVKDAIWSTTKEINEKAIADMKSYWIRVINWNEIIKLSMPLD
jgi:hypothetical protein